MSVKGKILEINAKSSAGKCNKKIQLPYTADRKTMQSSFHNGILEVTLKKIKKADG